jgi:hypothetical protein
MFKFGKKRVLALATVAALAVCGIAYAYWTTSGSGTGSGATGTNTAVTVAQTSTISGLVPGGDPQAVDFTITNPSSTPQYVTTVAVSISSVSGLNITAAHPCDASDFTLVQPTASYGDLAPGDTAYSLSGSTLKLKDTATNQDGCKNATVHLAFNAS